MMINLLEKRRYNQALNELKQYDYLDEINWPAYKAQFIEAFRLEVKLNTGCKDDVVYWNMQASFRRHQDRWMEILPIEFYSDLFVTLMQLSRLHNPKMWALLEQIRNFYNVPENSPEKT